MWIQIKVKNFACNNQDHRDEPSPNDQQSSTEQITSRPEFPCIMWKTIITSKWQHQLRRQIVTHFYVLLFNKRVLSAIFFSFFVLIDVWRCFSLKAEKHLSILIIAKNTSVCGVCRIFFFFSFLILRISIVSAQIWFLISEIFHFSRIT